MTLHLALHYAIEKYTKVRDALVSRPERIRERLSEAVAEPLNRDFDKLSDEVPEELKARIVAQNERLTAGPGVSGEGLMTSTIMAMTEDEAQAEADEIRNILFELEEVHSESTR